jgi:hypothetical protein
MKKGCIFVFLLGILLVAMLLTKPEPQAHYDAVVKLVQSVVDQEMTSDNVKKKMAQVGAEKLSELGIEGVDAEMLEKLGADVDLTEVTDLGKDVAKNTASYYLQSHLTVNDYYVVTVGILNYNGTNLPVTIGIMGKIFVLVDEEQVKHLL